MRARSLVLLGLAAYLAFLAAGVPARWLEQRLAAAAPGRYEAHAMSGTLWRGEGQAVVNVPGGTLLVDKVRWRFLPSRLLEGRLAFAFDVKGAGFEASYEAGRSFSGWGLRDLAVRADAALAAAALPFLGRWRPEGSVTAASPAIDVAGENDVRGEATIEWKSAGTTLSEVRPLGSYRAAISADGPGANVTVTTLEGPLRLSGNGRIEWPARLNFMGEARAEGSRAGGLAPLLDILGPARADGARTLDVRWR
jgi:general secretion pathway protein N